MSEEVNRKSPRRNTTVQPPTPTLSTTIHIVTYRQTDRQTDRQQYRANNRSSTNQAYNKMTVMYARKLTSRSSSTTVIK